MSRENSMWTKIKFGHHAKRTLPQVMFSDPEWFYLAYKENYFTGQLLAEARLIYEYSRFVKVPQGRVYELVGSEVKLVAKDADKQGERSNSLSFELPNGLSKDDYPKYLTSVERVVLGKVSQPYPKKLDVERFFSDPSRFEYKAIIGRTRGKRR